MPDEKEQKPELWELVNGKNEVIFVGTYEAVNQEWQRRHEKERKRFHDRNAQRQIRWEQRGMQDDERDRC